MVVKCFFGVVAHGCRVDLASDLSLSRIPLMGGKKQQDRANQGHAEELAIQFLEAALSKNELPEKEDVTLCETRLILRYN